MASETAKFHVGQVIHHTLFDYRGVIVDVDPEFRVGQALNGLEKRAGSGSGAAGGNRPWYHILVDGTADRTYVSEQNIEADPTGQPVDHPDIVDYFETRTDRGYISRARHVN